MYYNKGLAIQKNIPLIHRIIYEGGWYPSVWECVISDVGKWNLPSKGTGRKGRYSHVCTKHIETAQEKEIPLARGRTCDFLLSRYFSSFLLLPFFSSHGKYYHFEGQACIGSER